MNYIERVARAIRREVDPGAALGGSDASLFRVYAVLALAKGVRVTAKDVHNAWVAWMGERDPSHAALKPYPDLTLSVQAQDEPFVDAIRKVAQMLERGTHEGSHRASN